MNFKCHGISEGGWIENGQHQFDQNPVPASVLASFPGLARLLLAVQNLCRRPGSFHHVICATDIYLITRVSVQYRELLHEWAWYFHEPKASENAGHECNNRDMHANEYLLSITTTALCPFSHKVPSNSPFKRTGSN